MKKEYILTAFAVFCWSTLPPMVKLLLQDISNMDVLFISSSIAAVFLILILVITKKWKLLLSYRFIDYVELISLGFLGNFLYSILYYRGLKTLSSQDACIINYLWPIMAVIFSCFFLKEHLSGKRVVAIVLSFTSVFLIASKGESVFDFTSDSLSGIVDCILAAACYGLFNVLNKRKGKDQYVSMTIYFLTTAVCSGICYFSSNTHASINMNQMFGIVWLGIFIDALAFLAWALALQGSEVTFLTNFAYATPVLTMIISVSLLHEKIDGYSIAGMCIILLGFFLQIRSKSDGHKNM